MVPVKPATLDTRYLEWHALFKQVKIQTVKHLMEISVLTATKGISH